jgi:tRNA A-37 threonylcarbamoyl transferase component Bud32
MVVKRYNRPGRLRRWKDLVRVPRAVRALRNGAAFLRRDVPTPEPLAAFAVRRGGDRSWLVTRALSGFRSLAEIMGRADLLPDLVVLVRTMHDRGITHGDLKPVNIQVREGRERAFSLIDLDAAEIGRGVSRGGIVRDLAQLDSYARSVVAAAQRRAFFRRYAAGWDRERRRRILRWIVQESRRREARRCAV